MRLAGAAIAARGRFALALTGGTTPHAMYERLAMRYRDQVPWQAIECFWGDERHVPPTHADSNFRAAHVAMLGRVPVQPERIHRIPAERPKADDAAAEYEETLRRVFALDAGEIPAFDLVLLGMGPDAHVASLFPGNAALRERDRLVVAPWVEKLQSYRITMTLPVLNAGKVVMFLISGSSKADAVHAVLEGPERGDELPAQLIRPAGELVWLIDREAAAQLSRGVRL